LTILNASGEVVAGTPPERCDHGVTFDEDAARALLGDWQPKDAVEFVAGNRAASEVRKRWPRLYGTCPKGCGFSGIAYASHAHYIMGDW
jgi:hypothetical protein